MDPAPGEIEGLEVIGLSWAGKRIVFEFPEQRYAVVHLMIAGRLRWSEPGKKGAGRLAQARMGFEVGDLWLTEASKKKRASLHLVRGEDGLSEFRRGGLEVLDGRLLADRGLSQLMRKDWPRSLEELEERKEKGRSSGGDG